MQKIIELLNNKYIKVGVIALAIVLISIEGIVIVNQVSSNTKLTEDNKNSKQAIEQLNIGIKESQDRVESLMRDSVQGYILLAEKQHKVTENLHNKSNKIVYETKKRINSIDSIPHDSISGIFAKLAEQYRERRQYKGIF